MTAQDKLNRSARAHGWANWSEVLLHNAPPHVINLIVEEAMRGEPVGKPEPTLTWRPGARVRITSDRTWLKKGQEAYLYNERWVLDVRLWVCGLSPEYDEMGLYVIRESDAVVVG